MSDCYLCAIIIDNRVAGAYIRGPRPPWEAGQQLGDIDAVVFKTSGDTHDEAMQRMYKMIGYVLAQPFTSSLQQIMKLLNMAELEQAAAAAGTPQLSPEQSFFTTIVHKAKASKWSDGTAPAVPAPGWGTMEQIERLVPYAHDGELCVREGRLQINNCGRHHGDEAGCAMCDGSCPLPPDHG